MANNNMWFLAYNFLNRSQDLGKSQARKGKRHNMQEIEDVAFFLSSEMVDGRWSMVVTQQKSNGHRPGKFAMKLFVWPLDVKELHRKTPREGHRDIRMFTPLRTSNDRLT